MYYIFPQLGLSGIPQPLHSASTERLMELLLDVAIEPTRAPTLDYSSPRGAPCWFTDGESDANFAETLAARLSNVDEWLTEAVKQKRFEFDEPIHLCACQEEEEEHPSIVANTPDSLIFPSMRHNEQDEKGVNVVWVPVVFVYEQQPQQWPFYMEDVTDVNSVWDWSSTWAAGDCTRVCLWP